VALPSEEKTPSRGPSALLVSVEPLVASLYSQSGAERWGLARAQFVCGLERSVRKRFADGLPARERLEEYLFSLHIEDLALATACLEGCEAGWETFVREYRGYLRAAAGAITKASRYGSNPQELADSLFSDLFGLVDGKRGERSLFRYFHGRSSLKTWLRAVLVQRHIDAVRVGRRFVPLDDGEAGSERFGSRQGLALELPADPHRERYMKMFRRALDAALARLDPQDSERLRLYYVEEQTLAEIGRNLSEHESSVSRNLERIRRDLRRIVEEMLREGRAPADGFAGEPGLSDAEIALCFEYAAKDAPIDLDTLLPGPSTQGPAAGRQRP